MKNLFAGVGTLVRLGARGDRVRLPIWILSISALPFVTYASYASLFPSSASRAALGSTLGTNPALVLLYGSARNLSTPGGFTAWRTGVICCVFLSIMAIMTVVRHTRLEEESGRADLLGATCVGRLALSASGTLVAMISCGATGTLSAGLLALRGAPLASAALFGLLLALTGIVFAAVGLICAQVLTFARSATAAACALLALAYLVRAWGDTAHLAWMTWLSPLGWIEQAAPFGANDAWVALVPLAVATLLVVLGAALRLQRDVGAGMLSPRDGPAEAPRSLSGAYGLAWKLHARWSLIWTVGLSVFGGVFGAAVRSLTELLQKNPALTSLLAHVHGSLSDLYVSEVISILAVMATVVGVEVLLKAHGEETAERASLLLSSPLGRGRWFLSHLVIALGSSAAAIMAGGAALGGAAVATGSTVALPSVMAAAAVQLPAIWVLLALCAVLVGATARGSVLALPLVGATFVIMIFGPALDLPGALQALSVFSHLPLVPASPVRAGPLVALSGIALALGAVAFIGLERRDLA